jgi:hypothetical protein
MIEPFFVHLNPEKRLKNWHLLILVCIASLVSITINTPWLIHRYKEGTLFRDKGWEATYFKAEHLSHGLQKFAENSNAAKREFRLTIPALIKVLGHPPPWKVYCLQIAVGLLIFVVFFKLCESLFDWDVSLLFTLALPFLYFGRSAWVDLSGWFDTFAYFFILLGIWVKPTAAKGLFFFLAFWTDERAILAFPVVLLWENRAYLFYGQWKQMLNLNNLFFGGLLSLYFILRGLLHYFFCLTTPTADLGAPNFSKTLATFSLSQISFFEGFWLIVFITMGLLLAHKKWWLSAMILCILLIQNIVSFSVLDTTRSGCYWFPLILPLMYFLQEMKSQIISMKLLALMVFFITILIPGFFTLNGIQYLHGIHEDALLFLARKLSSL